MQQLKVYTKASSLFGYWWVNPRLPQLIKSWVNRFQLNLCSHWKLIVPIRYSSGTQSKQFSLRIRLGSDFCLSFYAWLPSENETKDNRFHRPSTTLPVLLQIMPTPCNRVLHFKFLCLSYTVQLSLISLLTRGTCNRAGHFTTLSLLLVM